MIDREVSVYDTELIAVLFEECIDELDRIFTVRALVIDKFHQRDFCICVPLGRIPLDCYVIGQLGAGPGVGSQSVVADYAAVPSSGHRLELNAQ